MITTTEVVLSERITPDGKVRWQARRSSDRGRLVLVAVVAPSDTETLVSPLTELELRDLLEGGATRCARAPRASADSRRLLRGVDDCATLFPTGPRFDGAGFDPAFDQARLTKQLGRVFDTLRDGTWRTLQEIADTTGDPHASISAQLRHLRKPRFGAYTIEKRHRGLPEHGLYEYRLLDASSLPRQERAG